MAGSLNKVILIGNVGKDPEVRSMQDGKEVASFSLATSEHWKDKMSGERRDKTEWHKIVVFSPGLINVIKQYVRKGSKLYIEGGLQTRKWTDQSGIERYTTEIVLQAYSTMVMLDNKSSDYGSFEHKEPSHLEERKDNSSYDNAPQIDDEIPF